MSIDHNYNSNSRQKILYHFRFLLFLQFTKDHQYLISTYSYNLCTDSLESTEDRMRQVQEHILRPALLSRTNDFEKMGKALIDGLWCFNPFLDYDAFLFMTARLTGVPGYYYWKEELPSPNSETKYQNFTRYSRFILYFLLLVHEVWLRSTIFRWYLNSQMIMSRFLITYFPFLAIFKFGIGDSYVRILK